MAYSDEAQAASRVNASPPRPSALGEQEGRKAGHEALARVGAGSAFAEPDPLREPGHAGGGERQEPEDRAGAFEIAATPGVEDGGAGGVEDPPEQRVEGPGARTPGRAKPVGSHTSSKPVT